MISKPMLATNCGGIENINFEQGILATPKIDGIRCLKIDGQVLSRKFKDIPNHHIRNTMAGLPDGLDGELIIEGKTFNEIQSLVMREEGTPDFKYWVFDYVTNLDMPYIERMEKLKELNLPAICFKLLPSMINNEQQLQAFEEFCVEKGYEGVMIRSLMSPYKCGRSTLREGYLLKLKRFEDSEAIVIGLEEKMHNNNEALKDAFGRTKRSSHQENLIPADTLGTFVVRDVKTNVEFRIGTGMNDEVRKLVWDCQSQFIGKIVTYTHQPSGAKDKPRFPVFKGFRDERDL